MQANTTRNQYNLYNQYYNWVQKFVPPLLQKPKLFKMSLVLQIFLRARLLYFQAFECSVSELQLHSHHCRSGGLRSMAVMQLKVALLLDLRAGFM